ncbi:hypothetical protein EJB05_18668 [Eragrostis curvula]|uniref:PCI domain-containing protein n=1 Tax=Eragrostis curvula TaxID=38414 RepID=A0A5J9VKR6_9POAL|nr:hypothetical protein EJB05_18668 [Eragrostis curvula]
MFQSQHVSQAPSYRHNPANFNQLPLSNQADQAFHLQGSRSNISSVNHVSEKCRPTRQDSVTLHAQGIKKIQIQTNPQIAPGFPIGMPIVPKSNVEADPSPKPAYLSVSIPKTDVKTMQGGQEAATQVTGSFPVSLRTYVEWNLSRCKDDTQKTAIRSILKEVNDSDKGQDLTKYYASSIALANSPEEKIRQHHRPKHFEWTHESSKPRNFVPDKDAAANTYAIRAMSLLNRSNGNDTDLSVEDLDWDALTIKGTCQEIEKRYLHLTSAPDPATVRPEDVLEKALHMVETSQKNYLYKCDQLKSIRQDLTVQRIQNELTVKVYETHARLAIQSGDLPEYNQWQSQLKRLYGEGVKGCHLEFSAYNLLCVMLHSYNKRDLLSSMASLLKEVKQAAAVKHALEVRSAISSGNYVLFFKLYKIAPNLNSFLVDLYVERMHFDAVKCMSKSYRPTVPVRYAAQVLGFVGINDNEDNGADRLEECEEWLKAHGAVLLVDNSGDLQIDTNVSSSSLCMPEPESAVSHGDPSLAMDYVLARASLEVLHQ